MEYGFRVLERVLPSYYGSRCCNRAMLYDTKLYLMAKRLPETIELSYDGFNMLSRVIKSLRFSKLNDR